MAARPMIEPKLCQEGKQTAGASHEKSPGRRVERETARRGRTAAEAENRRATEHRDYRMRNDASRIERTLTTPNEK